MQAQIEIVYHVTGAKKIVTVDADKAFAALRSYRAKTWIGDNGVRMGVKSARILPTAGLKKAVRED